MENVNIQLNQDRDVICSDTCMSPHWSYLQKCKTTAYVTIDGEPYCKKHANKFVLDKIVKGEYTCLK